MYKLTLLYLWLGKKHYTIGVLFSVNNHLKGVKTHFTKGNFKSFLKGQYALPWCYITNWLNEICIIYSQEINTIDAF
jgi:hypothetical protein